MNTIDFQARTGNGSEVVQVIMSYDEDIDGIFDKNIESVNAFNRYILVSILRSFNSFNYY
jgi:hypothetical protein